LTVLASENPDGNSDSFKNLQNFPVGNLQIVYDVDIYVLLFVYFLVKYSVLNA
jgi:hypothetical protein